MRTLRLRRGLWMLLVAALLSVPTHGAAAIYYVSAGGHGDSPNDANTCTQAQSPSTPKRNISGANGGLACLGTSDTLHIRGGTYNEAIDVSIQHVPTGTSWSAPLTIASYPGETATINGYVALQTNADLSTIAYVIFDRLIIDAGGSAGQITETKNAFYCGHGTSFILLQNSELRNTNANVVQVSHLSNGVQIVKNNIHHAFVSLFGGTHPTTGNYGMYVNGSNMIIDGNIIHDNTGLGINFYLTSSSGTQTINGTIRNNIAYNNGYNDGDRGLVQGGILIASGPNHIGYNNVAYNNAGAGIELAYDCIGCKLYNNTTYNNAGYGIATGSYGTHDSIIRNNIAYNNIPDNFIDYSASSPVVDHNLFGVNPLFVNAGGADFHLQSGSPARDTGVTLASFTTDQEGTIRANGSTTGSAYDIGAYEYTSSTPPPVATSLRFVQQPTSAFAGAVITPPVTVEVLDQYGVRMTSATNTVALALGTCSTLGGTTSVAASTGLATFSTLTVSTAGTGCTLSATASGLTGATSLAFSITSAGPVDLSTNLLVWWRFDEGQGSLTADSTGHGHTGTLVNGPQWVAGLLGPRGLLFDGLTSYVNRGTAAALDDIVQKTVAARVQLRGWGGASLGRVVDKRFPGWSMLVDNNDAPNALVYNQDWSGGGGSWAVFNTLSLGTPACVVVTYDRGSLSNVPIFYINKVAYTAPTVLAVPSGTISSDATATLKVGEGGAGNRGFDGVVDEVLLWSRILTQAEVNQVCDTVLVPQLSRFQPRK